MHTELAACAEDITAAAALERASTLGLAIGFVEHADQLYFPRKEYWKFEKNIGRESEIRKARDAGWSRWEEYRALAGSLRAGGILVGLEVEAGEDHEGLALIEEDARGWNYLLGAVHEFHGMTGKTEPMGELERDFMTQVRRLAAGGVDVLAHPFRAFQRKARPAPRDLYGPVADLLAAHGIAAEINFHTNRPDPEFLRACLDRGVKLAVGTDSHAISEVGTLDRHIALIRELGVWDRLDKVLWRPLRDGGNRATPGRDLILE